MIITYNLDGEFRLDTNALFLDITDRRSGQILNSIPIINKENFIKMYEQWVEPKHPTVSSRERIRR